MTGAKHLTIVVNGTHKRRGEEQNPTKEYQQHRDEYPQCLGNFGEKVLEYEFLQNDKNPMINAPKDKVPGGTVPQSGEQPDNGEIDELTVLGTAITTQGDIDIIPEPGAKGNMPPPPELRNAGGQIGVVKVFGKIKAKALGKTDCHIGIAGEIKIELETVEYHSQPCGTGRHGGKPGDGGEGSAKIVGNQHLFAQSHQKQADACAELCRRHAAVAELRSHVLILDNGTGRHLWEKGHIQGKIQKVLLYFSPSAVDVEHIAQDREGEERNAQRKRQVRSMQRQPCNGIDGGNQEAIVFEEAQDQQIDHHGGDHCSLCAGGTLLLPIGVQL